MSVKLRVVFARVALAVIVSMSIASSASAGLLNGHAGAYNDGNGPAGGAWTGSTAFDSDGTPNNGSLEGYVDWAVFGPGSFPYAGYTPTAGQLAYSYQVFVTGNPTDPSVTRFSVVLTNPANSIGAFASLPGVAPSTMSLVSAISADWEFASILPGANSTGLAFSSPLRPTNFFGSTINHGSSAVVIPLPSPSDMNIPEPAMMGVVSLAAIVLGRRARRPS